MKHPLFPADENTDDPAPDVEWIQVTRFEKGRQVWCPRKIDAAELTELEQLHAVYGGGHYELIARNAGDEKLKKLPKRQFRLPGKSLPFPGDEPEPEEKPAAAPAPGPFGAGADGGAMAVFGSIIVALINNGAQQAAAMMQLCTVMMTNSKTESRAQLEMVTRSFESNQKTSMEFAAKLAEVSRAAQPQASSSGDALAQGMELGLALGQGQNDGSKLIETFMGGINSVADTKAKQAEAAKAQADAAKAQAEAERARLQNGANGAAHAAE